MADAGSQVRRGIWVYGTEKEVMRYVCTRLSECTALGG